MSTFGEAYRDLFPAPSVREVYGIKYKRPGTRVESGITVCDFCGFALVTNDPRQCCERGSQSDAKVNDA